MVPQDCPQLPTQTGLHEHVEVLGVLERLVELDDESAVALLHNLLLRHDVLLLSGLNYLLLLHLLESEGTLLLVALDADQFDAAEAANAERREAGQVGERQVLEFVVDAGWRRNVKFKCAHFSIFRVL